MSVDFMRLGGIQGLRDGSWLSKLFVEAFQSFWDKANPDYFRAKYPKLSDDDIGRKIIAIASKNAGSVGLASATAMSAGEISSLLGFTTGGLTLPVSTGVMLTAIGSDLAGTTTIHLKLIAELGKLYGVALDRSDPEDIWEIIRFALFGEASDVARHATTFATRNPTKLLIKKVFAKNTLKAIQNAGGNLGVKILQRHLVQMSVPGVSMGVSTVWNFYSTRAVGRHAMARFKTAKAERSGDPGG